MLAGKASRIAKKNFARGVFKKVHFLEILQNDEILEIRENPQTCGKQSKN